MRMKDKVALVTGAGQNAGRATALELARHNCGGVAVNDFVGTQFAQPGYTLASESEVEGCVATYYDVSATVPANMMVDCPGAFPGTNDTGLSDSAFTAGVSAILSAIGTAGRILWVNLAYFDGANTNAIAQTIQTAIAPARYFRIRRYARANVVAQTASIRRLWLQG